MNYPDEAKVTHPDDVGERNMPARRTRVAGTDESNNPSVVRYGTTGEGKGSYLGRDLGAALKAMKEQRRAYPDKPAKMEATYE